MELKGSKHTRWTKYEAGPTADALPQELLCSPKASAPVPCSASGLWQ